MAQEASGKPTPCWKMLRKSAKLQSPSLWEGAGGRVVLTAINRKDED